MTQEGFKRKLTAILSADVFGYGRLMRDDENATVRDLAAHRAMAAIIVRQHNGRVIDLPGKKNVSVFEIKTRVVTYYCLFYPGSRI
jgi:class 3 adenylate cyclase